MNITREVVNDLWPLYVSGDASPDTCALIEEFLEGDPDFAQGLRENNSDPLTIPAAPLLPADHEMKVLDRVKRRLRGPRWLMLFAMVFSAQAFGRIISDTSWDVSPKAFIVTAAVAVGLWTAFFVVLFRGRRSVLIRLR